MNFAIVGATGIVGQEMIKCLYDRKVKIDSLRLLASARSAGKKMDTPFGEMVVEELGEAGFQKVDIALFAANGDIAKEWAPRAVEAGAVVIDNSSAFRYDDDKPLGLPEINPEAILKHKGIIANPNCTTAIAAIPLWAIHQNYGLKKVIISTYQAASGAGKEAMEELEHQAKDWAEGKKLDVKNFQHQILFNLIPHIDSFQENGYTREEMKVCWELRKIFDMPDLAVSCTAVRVPVMRAHSESIVVETEKEIGPEDVRKIFSEMKGIKVVDDPESNLYPMPINASENYDVEVGRIRQNIVFGKYGLEFFISGDQILKGAALNAIQIAELILARKK